MALFPQRKGNNPEEYASFVYAGPQWIVWSDDSEKKDWLIRIVL